MRQSRTARPVAAQIEPLEPRQLFAATFYVSPTGNDANPGTAAFPWRHVQKAFDSATPGSTVNVLPGTYNEKLTLNVSGTAAGGYITFRAQGNVVISGANRPGEDLISIRNKNYVRIVGFDLRDNLDVSDGSGVRITGSGDHIEIRSNKIHRVTGTDAMGITVYGTSLAGIRNLVIDNNEVYDCQPGRSEALTLNGNVSKFRVTNNYVHDVNNIGIDLIGGEGGMCPDPQKNAARDGVVSGNRVERARSDYDGGYAAGIYVDGGRNIVLERNVVTQCDLGIEVGCENRAGARSTGVASNITVRNNVVHRNDKAGLVFGGYASNTGRVRNSVFRHNTLYQNDTLNDGNGDLWIQFASDNKVEHNIVHALPGRPVVNFVASGTGNKLNYNLFHSPDGAAESEFVWAGRYYGGFAAYRSATTRDAKSTFADPKFVNAAGGNFHLSATSPAINAGNASFAAASGETDMDGQARVQRGRVDIGADEVP